VKTKHQKILCKIRGRTLNSEKQMTRKKVYSPITEFAEINRGAHTKQVKLWARIIPWDLPIRRVLESKEPIRRQLKWFMQPILF
jgi:hypothetical protein